MIRSSSAEDTTPKRHRRHDHLLQVDERPDRQRGIAAGRQPVQRQREDEDQQGRQPEIRDGAEDRGEQRDGGVGLALMIEGGDRAQAARR